MHVQVSLGDLPLFMDHIKRVVGRSVKNFKAELEIWPIQAHRRPYIIRVPYSGRFIIVPVHYRDVSLIRFVCAVRLQRNDYARQICLI